MLYKGFTRNDLATQVLEFTSHILDMDGSNKYIEFETQFFSQSPTANDVVSSNSCLMNLYLDESRAPPLNCMPLYAFRMVSQKMKGNLHQREISLW